MRPWENTHTVAVLWLIAACLAVGYMAGLVSLRLQEAEWGHEWTPVKTSTVPKDACRTTLRYVYCP